MCGLPFEDIEVNKKADVHIEALGKVCAVGWKGMGQRERERERVR